MRKGIVYFIVAALGWNQASVAQVPAVQAPAPQAGNTAYQVRGLRIIVLEGENAVNSTTARTGTPPVVEVRDENERPVEGASVTFTLPASGPGAIFPNGQRSQTATTDRQGQAGTSGFIINDTPGQFVIRVTASHQGLTATSLIHQMNSSKVTEYGTAAKPTKKWKWVMLGIVAGGGIVAGIYFATRSSSTPISISAGSVVVSGPR